MFPSFLRNFLRSSLLGLTDNKYYKASLFSTNHTEVHLWCTSSAVLLLSPENSRQSSYKGIPGLVYKTRPAHCRSSSEALLGRYRSKLVSPNLYCSRMHFPILKPLDQKESCTVRWKRSKVSSTTPLSDTTDHVNCAHINARAITAKKYRRFRREYSKTFHSCEAQSQRRKRAAPGRKDSGLPNLRIDLDQHAPLFLRFEQYSAFRVSLKTQHAERNVDHKSIALTLHHRYAPENRRLMHNRTMSLAGKNKTSKKTDGKTPKPAAENTVRTPRQPRTPQQPRGWE